MILFSSFVLKKRMTIIGCLLSIVIIAPCTATDAFGYSSFLFPKQITAEADPVEYVSVTRDGKYLAYISKREKFTDIWIRSADPAVVMIPRRLTRNPAAERSPVFSPDGKTLAFVGTHHDVKGDIYLLDLKDRQAKPVRLTGRDTEDGAPCFSPDGKKIYFHQKQPGEPNRKIAFIEIPEKLDSMNKRPQPTILPIAGDGSFPAVSPDGSELAFVTYREDPSGNISIFNLFDSMIREVTTGPQIDFFPDWTADGKAIYFSRISLDTNLDNTIDTRDNSAIYRTEKDSDHFRAFPLTSFRNSSTQPKLTRKKLFFLSSIKGVNNCWSLSIDGQVITANTAKEQMRLADTLSDILQNDPYSALLGYYRVLEAFSSNSAFAAKAAYRIGDIYLDLRMPDQSEIAYEWISQFYKQQFPEAPLARIQQIVIRIRKQLKNEYIAEKRAAIVTAGILKLKTIGRKNPSPVNIRSKIEIARLLIDTKEKPDALLRALEILESIITDPATSPVLVAETMILKADTYALIGSVQNVYPAYLSVLQKYPGIRKWADTALDRLLTLIISDSETATLDDNIKLLRKIARDTKVKTPMLSMGALNRLGDLFFNAQEWSKAKKAYRQVIDQFAVSNTQTAAARLALAEILYKEERFRQALDLYEAEIKLRPQDDHIHRLAWEGYIQKSLASAEYLYRLGEVSASRNTFKQLMDYDDTIVAAHRGYIKSAVSQNDLPKVLDVYKARLEKDPKDMIAVYGTALCLTYLDDQASLKKAKQLLYRAININGQIEYFHQALGYTLEVLETVHKVKGGLEFALESYKKAYFLNDHNTNPTNAAALLLNLGNTHFLMGQYAKAFYYFTQRLDVEKPFHNKNAAILFYRRLGSSAFQVQEIGKTIEAFSKALKLIDAGIAPREASFQFDRINRYIMNKALPPLLDTHGFKGKAKALAESQTEVNRELYRLTQYHRPPPSEEWNTYKKGIWSLIQKQKQINRQVVVMVKRLWKTDVSATQNPETVRSTLSVMITNVEASIGHAERLIQLKAEMFDRLALAYQESSDYEKAIEAYERSFETNKKLGIVQNLAKNKRSVAYNRYLLAGTLSGPERLNLLKQAEKEFEQVIVLLKQHGVPELKQQKSDSLLSFAVQMSLEETGTTRAGKGFSKDQEKRLAEAFIARINLELGRLTPAQKAIKAQLSYYPPGKSIQAEDIFGVSVLSHRAGHLSRARGKPLEAIRAFHRAASLSLDMKNPVSTAVNVANMAKLLAEIPLKTKVRNIFVTQIEALDKKTAQLFFQNPVSAQRQVEAIYHNRMGVYAPAIWSSSSTGLQGDVIRVKGLQRAVSHFLRGIHSLKEEQIANDREKIALLAALHLNMADASLRLGSKEKQGYHLQKALELSESGILPGIQWRAYVGLDRLSEAFNTLETITVLRARCGPGEIIGAFKKQIAELIAQKQIEAAFNLLEKVAEMERYHRLAPLIGDLNQSEKNLYRQIFRRLERIVALREKTASAGTDDITYLNERLAIEQTLLQELTGKKGKKLPGFIRLLSDKKMQEDMLMLLGIAAEAEAVADKLVKTSENPSAKNDHTRYNNLIKKYILERDKILFDKFGALSTSPVSLFGPEIFEAIDVMENLPKNGKLFRLFGPFKTAGKSETVFYSFILTPDNLTLHGPASLKELLNDFPKRNLGQTYVIHDYLDDITKANVVNDNIDGFALSAAHFIRSNMNQKPFKKSVLAIPGFPESITGYDLTIYPGFEDFPLTDIPKGIHTLLLSGRAYVSYSVPTRPGEIPRMSFVMESDKGNRVDMLEMLTHLSQLSLALFPSQSIKNAYPIGHLFSIYGCPTVILPSQPTADSLFIPDFLKVYQSNSATNALSQVRLQTNHLPFWLIIGHGGMSPEAAKQYAQKHFRSYVQKAKRAYENDQPAEAMALFESAIQIANDSETFKPYLPPLYQYARESAHQTGNYHRALYYANTLTDLMAIEQPDTAAHAESLLRLGLVYARLEQFEPSVRHLNEALEIFTSLELDPQKIETLSDLGVILEHATEYDQAIGIFQSAVSVGKTLDQKGLLARQYTSIGRINDLRLSRYAVAIENYQKGLELYQEMRSSSQNAGHIAQTLLNIGRCYRLIGNFIKADHFYANALKTIEAIPPDHRLRAKIVIEQANNAWYQARYTEAFKLQKISFRIATDHRLPLMQVISLNTAGLLWWSLGNYEKALSELNQAISIARLKGIRKGEIATTLNNIGLIYREMGQYSAALEAFDSALVIDRKLKSRWGVAYDLRHKGITFFKMQEPEKAIPLIENALNEAHAIGNLINESKALLNLGDIYFSIENRKEAETAYQKALKLSQDMSIHEIKWRSLYGLANLRLPDQPQAAERLLRQAIEVIESIRSNIKISQLKENFLFNKLMVYETLCRLLADDGKVSEAFEIAERSRSRNFIDLLGNQRLSLNRDIDQKLYDQQATLKERIIEQSALATQSTQNQEREIYEKALFKLKNDLDNVMLEIQHQNPHLLSLVSVKPLDVKELMQIIGSETALIDYYILADEILCWVVRPGKIQLFRTPIDRASLGEMILDFRRRIQNLEPLDNISKNLYNTLMAPVMPSLVGVKQIGIVPHGVLHYLSFATLWNGTDYLIDKFPLFYIPSASVLKYTVEKRLDEKNPNVLAIGNPDLGDPAFDLPFTEYEVDSIKWNFSNITTLTQERATEKWVVDHINEYGIIHLASHGEFDPINPLFSAIKLAKDSELDGNLVASEIFGLKIKADLVVLSACQTGLGKVTRGDDVIGLTRAFLYAGTHTLISTLWRVSDISTAILIKNFYRRYVKLNKADSLRQSMLHVKNKYPHPGYWGAFTLVGDYI